jgi:hypothetical protein
MKMSNMAGKSIDRNISSQKVVKFPENVGMNRKKDVKKE